MISIEHAKFTKSIRSKTYKVYKSKTRIFHQKKELSGKYNRKQTGMRQGNQQSLPEKQKSISIK